ncbi:hypothetical protein DS2_17467 [Catenovulum agarivorans DS-2]|uniref:Solute-binding protein family 3/N-terminal domain-containing protein n=1 Tax=Catenovulum agarivorans DS-2 TaxID=1328313 RepID=W7QJV0_9ALTE|nr:hypothetical protein [Catenovulum agarivorans]EWH08413.1 hypothetical protein DS2_17467 [Catenovulum agarivorans DS-2]
MALPQVVKTKRGFLAAVFAFIYVAFFNQIHAQTINYYIEEVALQEYNKRILQMALANVDMQGVTLNAVTDKLSREQAFTQMDRGDIDVMWLNTSQELEDRFIPVRVPMFKGLMSYRVLMIRQGNESRFADVNDFQQFRQLKGGVGRFWTTTKVFKAENINSVLTTKATNLYPMLEGGRFDYIPRGVMEIAPELKKYSNLPLALEKTLLLHLPTAVYPFVSKSNPKLAVKIEEGMLNAIDSGEFDAYFKTTSQYQDTLKIISQYKWKVIPINNPILPKATPLSNKKLWVDFSQYLQ